MGILQFFKEREWDKTTVARAARGRVPVFTGDNKSEPLSETYT